MNETSSMALSHQPLSFSEKLRCNIKHLPVKRVFDITFSLMVMLLGLPIFAFIALAIKLTSRGKVIYFHERVGRGGKTFPCYKFRTMHEDADERLEEMLKNDQDLRSEWETTHKLKNDPRITPIGNFLRKASLDELPQFWNVLRGDLSVVGPRPVVQQEIIEHFGSKAIKILSVRPGLTGIWQVSGRSNTTYTQRIQLDERYVDNHSLALDIKLIMKTIPCMMNANGAY